MTRKNVITECDNKFEELDSIELKEIEGGADIITEFVIKVYRDIKGIFN